MISVYFISFTTTTLRTTRTTTATTTTTDSTTSGDDKVFALRPITVSAAERRVTSTAMQQLGRFSVQAELARDFFKLHV